MQHVGSWSWHTGLFFASAQLLSNCGAECAGSVVAPQELSCSEACDILVPCEVKVKSLSCVQLFATPWPVAYQAPLSMGFSRREYWTGLPFPSTEDLPNPGIEPESPALRADALTSKPPGKQPLTRDQILPWKADS